MILDDLTNWLESFASYGYLGVFFISLLGATSIFVPIPSTVVIFIIAGNTAFDPVLIAVFAGLGAAVGEFTGYLVGLGGRKVIGNRYKKKMDVLMRLFKRFGPVVIFLFALTPLPDDLVFVPLGMMRYSVLGAFIPALLGKLLSNLIVAYAGRYLIFAVRDFFGVEGEGMSLLIGTILAVVLLVVVLVIMFKVNWEKIAEKYLDATEKPSAKPAEKADAETPKHDAAEENG